MLRPSPMITMLQRPYFTILGILWRSIRLYQTVISIPVASEFVFEPERCAIVLASLYVMVQSIDVLEETELFRLISKDESTRIEVDSARSATPR